MTAAFLPRNPSNAYALNLSRPRTLHKTIIGPQTPQTHTHVHTHDLRAHRGDSDGRSPNISRGNYEQELQQRINAVQDVHNIYYNAIASDVQERNAIRQERLLHAKHERDLIAEAERQEHERIERSQLEARRRRLAEEVEQQRIEHERLQREWEEAQAAHLAQIAAEEAERQRILTEEAEWQRVEDERRRREWEEAQAAHLAQIAAEEAERQRILAEEAEWQRVEDERRRRERDEAQAARLARLAAEDDRRRRQAEQAERIRRERLRECAVCFDSQDMDMMVQVACAHWYCIEDLRSMSTLCRSSDQS